MKNNVFVISLVLMLAIIMTSIMPLYATDEKTAAESIAEAVTTNADSESESPMDAESSVDEPPVIPESSEDFLSFEGYQVRETGYNGLRAIFRITIEAMPTLEADGLKVIEYGTAIAATEYLEKMGEELTVSKNDDGEYKTVSYGKLFPIMKNDGYVGKLLENNDEYVEYACTVTNFTIKTFKKDVTFRGYAVLCDANGEEYVVYSDYPIVSYRSVSLGQMCDEMLKDGTITKNNISYKHVVTFREEEGWGPIWRP